MCNNNEFELKIVKFIDYIYINNFITNTLQSEQNNSLLKKNSIPKYYDQYKKDNEWKIFSTHYNDESINILYFIKIVKSQENYNYDILLISLHIYTKICEKYAHQIENYTYLYASVYIAVNKIICDEYLTEIFMAQILNISNNIAKNMVSIVDMFMDANDIYFDSMEKEKLISNILC